jgi:hypothetical protein
MNTEITEMNEICLSDLIELGRMKIETAEAEYRRQEEAEAQAVVERREQVKMLAMEQLPLAVWPYARLDRIYYSGGVETVVIRIEALTLAPVVVRYNVQTSLENLLMVQMIGDYQVMEYSPQVDLEFEPGYFAKERLSCQYDTIEEALFEAARIGDQRQAVTERAKELAEQKRKTLDAQMQDEDIEVEERLSLLTKAEELLSIDARADGALVAAVRALGYAMLYQARG